jgi:hypothetical protein
MTGFAWLQANDPDGYKEAQPSQREIPTNPRLFAELLGGVGVRKEFGVHRQTVVPNPTDE